MTSPELYRVDGAWVRRAASDPEPPDPDPVTQTAIHIQNRVLFGYDCQESGGQLPLATALSFSGAIYVRRMFVSGWITATAINNNLTTATAGGYVCWLSFKVPGNDWAGVTAGDYDDDLDILKARVTARPESWIVSIHHEPSGDGDLAVWAAMQTYLSNYLASVNDKLCFAPITNGWWWGAHHGSAANVAAGAPQSLITTLNTNRHMLAADCYDSNDPTRLDYTVYDRTSDTMQGFVDYARAKGAHAVGIGEWGCHNAEDVRRSWNVMANNCDLVEAASYWNSAQNARANWLLVPATYVAPSSAFNGSATTAARLATFVQAKTNSLVANPAVIP